MPYFELTFVTPTPITDEIEDSLFATGEDIFIGGHHPLTLITTVIEGATAEAAAKLAQSAINSCGVLIERIYPDLVTRAQIAERTNVSRQAVGHWIKGERQTAPFPLPFFMPGGTEVWLWSEVNEWLKQVGREHDEVAYPTRDELRVIDYRLRTRSNANTWDFRGSIVPGAIPVHHDESDLGGDWTPVTA